ncbi:lipopolysaccharide biosynthesis protein [filamentous cyanobacterium LEGE 11480]|uniref:Lipopolysaccharide biosynthesis protein n=1 Tax=Romeriopsis navalis LEGE 11480 TaxID=2777977 RepID=A0A928Z578_9CYAN|nr:lipopolysaccharide biosynthesis protein [Romeriopsis navalis]MBE9030965.1 lipopolysaccharide biosynthesis protein [Romeriopsis navalis LEGE 11480]
MLKARLQSILSGQFIRNMGWLGSAELLNRVLRLGTTVTLARLLTPYDYGLAAVILTTQEIANVFTLRSGIGAKLIQAKEEDLDILCNTAYWMNWILCIGMFTLQCLVAFPVGWFYGNNAVVLPICIIALNYLLLPTFAVQGSLIFRENRLKIPAICNAVQSGLMNALTITFALMGMGFWSIVLPILLTVPVWVIINRAHHPWRPTGKFSLERWQELANFAANFLGVELLTKIRANVDYLLVGRFLGIEALGMYYFAFNAGLGISLSVIQSFTWSIYPHLCEVKDNLAAMRQRYFKSLKTIAMIIVPMVLLQASLAPVYVPIVFSQKWVSAIPILILICLSAIPRPFAEAASMLLQSVDKGRLDLYWNAIFTGLFIACILGAMQFGIYGVAVSVLVVHVLAIPLFSLWAKNYVFRFSRPRLAPSK